MQRRNQPRRLTCESLEARQVMDGTVVVSLVGNTLSVTGDNARNTLIVKMNGANLLLEGNTGLEGGLTNVSFQGQVRTSQEFVGLDHSKLELKFNLKGGDDVVHLGDVNSQLFMKSLRIDTGAGADTVALINTGILGKTSIKTFGSAAENDADTMAMFATNQFLGDFSVRTGGGNDSVFTANGSPTFFAAKSSWDLGAGNDGLLLQNCFALKDVRVQLGEGANTFISRSVAASAKFEVRSGKGGDTVTADGASTYSKLSFNLGAGDDKFSADGLTVADIRVNLGKGNDTVNGNALDMTKFDLFDGGTGNDTFNFNATNSKIPAAGKLPKNFEVQNIT